MDARRSSVGEDAVVQDVAVCLEEQHRALQRALSQWGAHVADDASYVPRRVRDVVLPAVRHAACTLGELAEELQQCIVATPSEEDLRDAMVDMATPAVLLRVLQWLEGQCGGTTGTTDTTSDTSDEAASATTSHELDA